MLGKFIDFVFPPLCVHCRREGAWLCAAAHGQIRDEPVLVNPLIIPGIDLVVTRGRYDCQPLADLVQKIKYSYWRAAQNVLKDLLRPIISALPPLDPDTIIIPVPLHRQRSRERGFNQSHLLAMALSTLTNRPVVELLIRHRPTKAQAKLSEQERLTNMTAAFQARPNVAKWPKFVIIVDDVVTTGSTFRACAVVLKEAGVSHISAVALAKG